MFNHVCHDLFKSNLEVSFSFPFYSSFYSPHHTLLSLLLFDLLVLLLLLLFVLLLLRLLLLRLLLLLLLSLSLLSLLIASVCSQQTILADGRGDKLIKLGMSLLQFTPALSNILQLCPLYSSPV